MKKLLFVISQLYKGGAETSLVNLLNNLDKNKYKIDVVILNQYEVKEAVSLIPYIPKWVKVYDAYKSNKNIFIKLKGKALFSKHSRNVYNSAALNFVKNKSYDWAFFVGEWYNPEFVAAHVNAKKKAAWIHSDISKADYFNSEEYFEYLSCFDKYIFVSQNSLESSCNMFKFIKDKATTIYNISDTKKIRKLSTEPITDYDTKGEFTLLTCANIRPEKNHLRQVEVLKILKDRGISLTWVNVGNTANKALTQDVKRKVREYNLEDNFILLGAKNNPYKYMKQANAVTVLSDHESWSMVITEAKVLGIPVIATKTSGALEQLEHEVTGILTDFTAQDIADKIEKFVKDKQLQEKIKNNISNFDNTAQIIDEFDKLINTKEHKNEKTNDIDKILYVIDDINYLGGAHIATKYQINKFLELGKDITIFSTTIPKPSIRNELLGTKFLSCRELREDQIYNMRLMGCLLDKNSKIKEKILKIRMSIKGKILRDYKVFDEEVLPKFSNLFANYDIICVMSECSVFKKVVSETKCKKKIQWIHIDYCDWINRSEWAAKQTKYDGEIWKKYDEIVVLTENIKESVSKKYPHLKNKIQVMKNIMPVEGIKRKSNILKKDDDRVNFITVGRVEKQKAYERLIPILARLKKEGYKFNWTIIGNGMEYNKVYNMINDNGLNDMVFMEGARNNPFPYIKEADVFALMSEYEGLPNTIYESLILGVPVIATNVGGVNTQVINGKTGWLINNDSDSIYKGIKNILDHREEIEFLKNELKDYEYDNEEIYQKAYTIFK